MPLKTARKPRERQKSTEGVDGETRLQAGWKERAMVLRSEVHESCEVERWRVAADAAGSRNEPCRFLVAGVGERVAGTYGSTSPNPPR
jgi:hypothetical protein